MASRRWPTGWAKRFYYLRGTVERYRSSNRGYVRMPGYSTNSPNGQPRQPWMTHRECLDEAWRDSVRAVFVK